MKVASFESLEFLLSKSRKQYYVIGLQGSHSQEFTKANYDPDKIIAPVIRGKKSGAQQIEFAFTADEEKLIENTNLEELIKAKEVDAFMPDTYTSDFLEKWGKKNGVKMISTANKLQKKYEDKIFFNKFLKKYNLPVPKSLVLKSDENLSKIDVFPVIVQIPNSKGSAGTFLMHNKNEIIQLFSANKAAKYPLLCRQFIDNGIALGVSVLIGPKNMIFSAIRMQAYFLQNNGKSNYYGIQWIKTSSFSHTVIDKLNKILTKAGKEMQKAGFRGIASFDLMLRDEDIYFIECNPRTGGSTPQMSYQTELLHGLNLTDEFIRCTTGRELSDDKPFIPESDYEGFTLDLGFMSDYLPKGLPLNCLKSGIYKYQNNSLDYISASIDDFNQKSSALIYYVRPEGDALNPCNFIGFMIIHFPLLKIDKNSYSFSGDAKEFIKYMENLIIKK
jgi:glutathione synthase/RimK-type ligase-like ATP-grasp enzyme